MAENSGGGSSSSGPGCLTLMFILFLGLKLGGVQPVAGWSWWWVTAPVWGGAALVLSLMGLAFVAALIAVWWESR